MPIPYIWFGDNVVVDSDGKLVASSLNNGTDKWSVIALLHWNSTASPQVFTPALLVRNENQILRKLLELLDAEVDSEAAVTDAIPTGWSVLRFKGMALQLPDNSTVTLAVDTQAQHVFLKHETVSTAVKLTSGPFTIGGVVNVEKVEGAVIADTANSAKVTITITVKDVNLTGVGFKTPFVIGKPVTLEYSIADGKLKLNGETLDSTVEPYGKKLGDFSLVIEDQAKVAFEIPVDEGKYTHQPLVTGIPGSKVDFDWKKFRIRLRDDQLGLAAAPGDSGDELGTAKFTLPLIQAAVGAETTNALAKLVPSSAPALTPLTYTVKIYRPKGTIDASILVWTVERGKRVGQFVEKLGQKLLAAFESDSATDTDLTSFFAPLEELAGKAGDALAFRIETVSKALDDSDNSLVEAIKKLDARDTDDFQLPLALKIGKDKAKPELVFLIVLRINLWTGRLSDNRAYFYVASGTGTAADRHILDLTAFAMTLPVRTVTELKAILEGTDKNPLPEKGLPSKTQHDGYLDFEGLDVVLDVQPVSQTNRPQLAVLFPGGLTKDDNDSISKEEEEKRVRILLNDFDPEIWPEPPKPTLKTLQLRLGARGLTFAAEADTVKEAKITITGDASVPLRLVETRDGLRSGLVVIDNQVRYANLAGRISIPGLDNFEADVSLGLRRDQQGPPVVTAVIDIDRTDRKSLARMRIPLLKMQLDDLWMQLTWKTVDGKSDWDFRAWATGAISITGDLGSTGGIEGLDQPQAIPFRDLDLTRLHQDQGNIPLGRPVNQDPGQPANGGPSNSTPSTVDQVARFELLEKQFRIEFYNSILFWNIKEKTASFVVERARFEYQASSGDLDVAIEAGEIKLHFDGNKRSLKFETPSSFWLQVRIGTQLSFAGNVGWEDTPTENYFRADGRLRMTGFPEVAGSLKLGTGIKNDGKTAPNLAIFAELPYEADLFSGVVLKRVGLGLGLNNRLAGIGDRPDPRAILANLDRIDPKQSSNWSFVTEAGVYVSVVATAMIASNRGKDDVVCAYVAKLLLSVDTNIDIVAAAQVWLFSSPGYITQQDHERRPALIGAAVLSARERTFSLVAQTTPRPAIESNQMLSDLLSRVQARFSFYLSSDLADFYLEELSYRDQLFGINVVVIGSYRIAIGRFGALMRAMLSLRGELPEKKLQGGIGGFSFRGNFGLDADFGGLVSNRGLAAYGSIRVGISFRVSAFVNIPTVAFETIEYEETFSITISIPYLKCKRWKCKWKTREISESVTIRIKLVYPVFSIEEYHLPESSLDLLLEGVVAFDESGGIGFSGRLAISTSVCGHQLRISPRFDYRPEVATNVRRRVAAIEDQINRLRGLPRAPVQTLPADEAKDMPPVETWYYYKSVSGDKVYHLLVPSPEYPQWWYTPRAADMSQYANLPRDTSVAPGSVGAASEMEKRHLSPLRDAVMRMVLPFKSSDGNSDDIKQIVDLAMPWDRGNYDSLPDEKDDQELIDLVMKLTQIESAFLNTAAKATSDTTEGVDWKMQEDRGAPLTDVEIVSDPRPESSARVYWNLTDQMTRPDGVYPFRYRPVQELVSEGFSGVSRRGDIGRLLRFDQVSQRAVVQGRYEDAAPSAASRLRNARATLLSTILADLTREGGPQRYEPIEAIKLVQKDKQEKKIVTRRRFALLLPPTDDSGTKKFIVKVNYAILENSTDLDLATDQANPARFVLKWPGQPLTANEFTLDGIDPTQDVDRQKDLGLPIVIGEADSAELYFKPFPVTVERVTENSDDAKGAPEEAILLFLPIPAELSDPAKTADPQVGLFAVTAKDVQLDLQNVHVFRNESSTGVVGGDPVSWSRNRSVRIIPMNDNGDVADPIEAVQRWVGCLPPCQEFLSSDQNVETNEAPRVRVRLPVKFDEQLLKAELPRLNGFEIYRRFPWDPRPVKIAEGVPPVLRTVDEGNRKVLLVESFLFGEDFVFDRKTGRFTGSAAAVIPGVTPIEYSLRAVPFGRLDSSNNTRPTFRRWPAVTLHVPPVQRQLPALGIVISVDSLFLPKDQTEIKIHLVDSRHATWDWPEKSWEELEIWAEPQRIRSSGSYAIEGEPQEVDPQAAARQTVRDPSDLTVERIPESVSGKILVARLQRPMPDGKIAANATDLTDGLKALQPGFGYRFFIRPSVTTHSPLVQPLALHLIRQLPPRMDEATPVLHVDRLELIEQAEVDRVMMPIDKVGNQPRENAWVPGADFRVVRRTEDNDEFEHLRIEWDHLSDLDAGVEILLQDVDEPHRIDRQLVTAQEEAVFQMAIQDFRNPALWRAFPNRKSFTADWEALSALAGDSAPNTPSDDRTNMILWAHESNPAIARVGKARTELIVQLGPYAKAPTKDNDWGMLHRAIAEYIAAMFAYQRTPLAPATLADREGLELLINLSQALMLGLKIPAKSLPDATDPAALRMALDKQEVKLREMLREIESIDLSQMEVNDSPAAYAELKLQLHDIDIAKQLAGIAARRLAAADDLLDLTAADEIPMGDSERLPLYDTWQTLVARFKKHFRVNIASITPGATTIVTTTEDHNLVNGEMIEFNGVDSLENQEFSATVDSENRKKITLSGLKSTISTFPTLSSVSIERVVSQHARPLVRLFEDRLKDNHATGQLAAEQLIKLTELLRDPSVLLKRDAPDQKYRKEVAKLVPLVSGMVAALDALKADAQANDWTLVRRPHHQLAVQETQAGRVAVEEPLSLYLPDAIGGPNPRADRPDLTKDGVELVNVELIIPFVNLLERLGCAVDLAVVDALNQPLPQARLLEWIGGQPWSAILKTVIGTNNTELKHEVVLITGREPDTDREMPKSVENASHKQEEHRSLGYAFVKLAVVPRTLLTDILKKTPSDDGVNEQFRLWLQDRSFTNAPASTRPASPAEGEAVRKMAEAWWKSISRLPGTPEDKSVQQVGHCIVETRGRRWATVPVLGGRAHIDWKASDAAGRLLQVAVRRVSRYEGLLRWARGTAVPMLPRIHGLTVKQTQTLSLRRRMAANEEPKTLPVLISPHPTRIEFIYALPTSGARATVSGLSARRTGYQGITAQFSHRRIDGPSTPTVKELIGGIKQYESLIMIEVTDATNQNVWKVTSEGLKKAKTVVLFDANREHVLAGQFTPDSQDSASGTLNFVATGDFPIPANGLDVAALTDPLTKSVADNALIGTITRIGPAGSKRFRLTLDDKSVAMNEDPESYLGQLLLTVDTGSLPTQACLVQAFSVADQTIELDKALSNNQNEYSVRLLTGVATAQRTPIVRSETGVPNLFRHERLISLPDLPYYRKYEAHVGPQFDAVMPSGKDTGETDPVFAERKPSILAVHPPSLSFEKTNTEITYAFRLLLTRQGDLLTPAEIDVDRELEFTENDNDVPLLLNKNLSAADLPDLNCTYQILWELPDSSATDPIYAELVEVLLPGSPQWKKPGDGSSFDPKVKPVLIQNRNGTDDVKLEAAYVPIQLWWPSKISRPVYVVRFNVKVSVSLNGTFPGDIFKNMELAWLQLQRDGYRSRPVKIMPISKSE